MRKKRGRVEMVLNHDCVREILLAVEQCPFDQTLNVEKLAEKLPDFDEETICYACLKMDEGNLLNMEVLLPSMSNMPNVGRIYSMTYKGHEFLDTIREKSVLERATAALKKGGGFSLKLLEEVAKEIVKTAAIAAIQSNL